MVTYRPDISFPVIKLFKYANRPAKEHYMAMKKLFRYLRHTVDNGITFWRQHLQKIPHLKQSISPEIVHQQSQPIDNEDRFTLIVSADSDWASDTSNRKSVSGIIMHLAGGAVHYKTSYQKNIIRSSTEAEFVAACDAAKMAIYLRPLLDEIGIPQNHAMMIYEDNTDALMMVNAGQPTRCTRHMDIRYFAIQDWVEEDLVVLEHIHTSNNSADTFAKALGRTLFHKHRDVIMGQAPPKYYQGNIKPFYKEPQKQVSSTYKDTELMPRITPSSK